MDARGALLSAAPAENGASSAANFGDSDAVCRICLEGVDDPSPFADVRFSH
jgi:hypothetical protein